jgi:hypothetical protein
MAIIDATINVYRTRLNQFGKSFGIVEITGQDRSVIEFHATQKKIVDISELLTFYIRKFKQHIDEIEFPNNVYYILNDINKLIGRILELFGLSQEIIIQI